MASLARDPVENWWRSIDRVLVVVVVALLASGAVLSFVSSPQMATRHGLDAFHFAMRHGAHAVLALLLMLAASTLGEREVRRFGLILFVLAFIALALLPWFGSGFGKGSIRWYSLGGFSFQPSEFMKLGLALTISWFLVGSYQESGPPGKTIALVLSLLVVALLALQPDFGQALLVMGAWGVAYSLAGANPLLLLAVLLGAAGMAWAAYTFHPYVRDRVDGFRTGDVSDFSQVGMVEGALEDGGLFGRGFDAGGFSGAIPDAHSDFVVAVAVREFGLVASFALLLVFAVLALRVAWRVRRLTSPYAQLAGAGIAALISLQALVHFGVNLQLLPPTGMTLPFVSYGGSSLIASGITMGVLLALTRDRQTRARRKRT